MFETITNEDERGQVGIGTLIVFIAMVLVAAIAAGVLINTAGLLQSQADATSQDSQAQVSDYINVLHANANISQGVATGAAAGDAKNVTLVVKRAPGANPIQLEETTIHWTSDVQSLVLNHTDDPSTHSGTFNTTGVGGADDTVLQEAADQIEVKIELDNTDSSAPNPLAEGDQVQLDIIDQSGATTVHTLDMPEAITDNHKVVSV